VTNFPTQILQVHYLLITKEYSYTSTSSPGLHGLF